MLLLAAGHPAREGEASGDGFSLAWHGGEGKRGFQLAQGPAPSSRYTGYGWLEIP